MSFRESRSQFSSESSKGPTDSSVHKRGHGKNDDDSAAQAEEKAEGVKAKKPKKRVTLAEFQAEVELPAEPVVPKKLGFFGSLFGGPADGEKAPASAIDAGAGTFSPGNHSHSLGAIIEEDEDSQASSEDGRGKWGGDEDASRRDVDDEGLTKIQLAKKRAKAARIRAKKSAEKAKLLESDFGGDVETAVMVPTRGQHEHVTAASVSHLPHRKGQAPAAGALHEKGKHGHQHEQRQPSDPPYGKHEDTPQLKAMFVGVDSESEEEEEEEEEESSNSSSSAEDDDDSSNSSSSEESSSEESSSEETGSHSSHGSHSSGGDTKSTVHKPKSIPTRKRPSATNAGPPAPAPPPPSGGRRPPPPTPPGGTGRPPPPRPPGGSSASARATPPPPPAPFRPRLASALGSALAGSNMSMLRRVSKKEPKVDPRANLLSSIQKGNSGLKSVGRPSLRAKVEKVKPQKNAAIAAILSNRSKITGHGGSDSESDGDDSDSDYSF